MKRISIITDSTCDLSKELLEKYEIKVLPLYVNLGDKEYRDGVDITPEDIYNWADKNNETPKTSTISFAEAKECLEEALKLSEKVIAFSISRDMSSCFSVIQMAAIEMELEDKVFVINSKNLSTGIGLQIIEAAKMIEDGMEAEEIVARIKEIQPYVRASFVVDTLTYLHRGGRCSGLAAIAGSALKMHPYIMVKNGKMQPGKKYRGKMKRVISDYVSDLKEDLKKAKSDMVFITHSGCSDEIIEMVKAQLEELNYFKNIYITRAGSVISSHCGPGTLGVLFIEDKIEKM